MTHEMTATVPGRRVWSRRWVRWPAYGAGALALFGMVAMVAPVPGLDGFLAGLIADQVRAQVSCPGAAAPPKITVEGGRLLPQVLHQRLSQIDLTLPDLTVNGVKHASFTATLRDVTQPKPGLSHVGSMDATITVGFAGLPAPPAGTPVPTYGRAPDGSLTVTVDVSPEAAKDVTAKLYLKMELRGDSIASVPQQLTIFGRTLPAAQVADMTGGERTQKLPALPAGLNYRSIAPEPDGLHVALDGVSTTPLNTLPTTVSGRTVSYLARNGELGIATAVQVPPIVNIPLTIFTEPQLTDGTLTLVPRSVEILGADRPPSDVLAKLVLSQIKQQDLSRKLPALPAGIRYRSVSVDPGGIKVAVGGVTVQPFATFPQPPGGPPTTYGAENGLLTATSKGGNGQPMHVVLYARPTIDGNTLDITPQQFLMFGTLFPASAVLAEVKTPDTRYPLQALPTNLRYQSVEVLPTGMRIHLTGKDVTLPKGMLGGAGC